MILPCVQINYTTAKIKLSWHDHGQCLEKFSPFQHGWRQVKKNATRTIQRCTDGFLRNEIPEGFVLVVALES